MVDRWIELCNSNQLVKYFGGYLETRLIRRQWAAFSVQTVSTHLYRSLQHWDTEWIIAGDEAHNIDIIQVKMLAERLKTA